MQNVPLYWMRLEQKPKLRKLKMKNKMKTMKLNKTIALAVAGTFLFVSCSKDPVTIDDGGNNNGVLPNGATITGTITENTTLSKGNNYILKGGVHVKQGATLTREEGATVKSDPDEPVAAYLLIEPCAKRNAVRTEHARLVLTSGGASPKSPDW